MSIIPNKKPAPARAPHAGELRDRVRVRPARPDDAQLLFRWRRAPSVRRFQPLREVSVAQLREDIQNHSRGDLERGIGDRFQWMIEQGSTPIGWITLVVGNWEHGLAELGYALAPEAQGRGLMREALTLVMPDLMIRSPLERIEARCAIDNVASARVLESLGFVREGVLREYFRLHGRRVDHYLYGLLRADFIPQLPPVD